MPSSCRLDDYCREQQPKNLAPTVTFTEIQDKDDIPSLPQVLQITDISSPFPTRWASLLLPVLCAAGQGTAVPC